MASTRKSSHPTHNIFDFSDIFLEDSKIQEIRNLQVRSHAQGVPDQSRFLKRNQTMDNKYLTSKADCVPGRLSSCGAPTTTSKIRASAALMKLAQIETKIKNRKKACTTLSGTESDSQTMDENLLEGTNRIAVHSTAVCSSQHTHRTFLKQAREIPITKSNMASGKVSRFLKKKEPPVENASPDTHIEKVNNVQTPRQKEPARKFDFDFPDSDEEEMKELLGSLLESSREKEKFMNQELVSTKDEIPTQPRVLSVLSVELSSSEPSQRTLCLLASQTAPRTRHSTRSRACSPQDTVSCASSLYISDNFSKSVSSKMGCIRLASSQSKSEVGPSGEPVSEVADDSLDDFRVNVLSLDDLVPAITEKDMEQKEEDAGRKGLSGKSFPAKSPARLEAQKPSPPRNSAFQGKSTSLVGDKSLTTPSEVSEHLSASSASASHPHSVSSMDSAEVPMMHTAIPTYSEDFKHSLTPMTSESTTSSFESLDRTLDALSQFSLKTDLLKPSLSRTKRGQDITRIIMKETAVQTLDPTFAYQWSTAGGVATMGPALGGTYVDPVPIASHFISADAIEALTAYSPAMLALNDMLKQQLSLTQQSIEATRHLHISLLQSLDRDAFHYHTLEEAKEYIKCHRPAPLTMEAALQEVKEEL